MPKMKESFFEIRILDELALKETIIHNLHPLSKLLVTVMYLVAVISYDKYEIDKLLPFISYPLFIFILGEIPPAPLGKRMLISMVFVAGLGMFNPFLDKTIKIMVGDIPITGGWLSFLSLIIKSGLTILAGLLLVATTGVDRLALGLRSLRVPSILIFQLVMVFRYITVFLEEIDKTYHAYMLRAPGQTGIHFRAWGPLGGQILLRTFRRGEKIYEAMLLRGFGGEYHPGRLKRPVFKDLLYLLGWAILFGVFRFGNIPAWLSTMGMGVIR